MIFAEIAQGKAVQMPFVGRIAKRAEIRVMGGDDKDAAPGLEEPVEFLDGPDDVRDVLDQMDCADFTKRAVPEGEREMVEIGKYVRIGVRVAVDADCARIFLDPAAYVEYLIVQSIRRRRMMPQATRISVLVRRD